MRYRAAWAVVLWASAFSRRLCAAGALTIALGVGFAPSAARADWACEVHLCLAAPNPWSIKECLPALNQLLDWWRNKNSGLPFCQYLGEQPSYRGATGDWCPEELKRDHPDIKDAKFCLAKGSIDIEGTPKRRLWWGITDESGNLTTFTQELK